MEHRIEKLEDFQKKWEFYFWAVVAIAAIAGSIFGFKLTNIWDEIDEINQSIQKRKGEVINTSEQLLSIDSKLKDLDKKIEKISLNIDESSKVADKISLILQKNAIKSSEIDMLVKNSIDSSRAAMDSAIEAKKISSNLIVDKKNSKSVVDDIAKKEISNNDIVNDKIMPNLAEIYLAVNGSNNHIHFIPGHSDLSKIEVMGSNNNKIINVPNDKIVILTGTGSNCTFLISKELKGRVVDKFSGSNNEWKIEN